MPNIGLVLSGGFAKGAYQVGVLKALSEYLQPDDITYICASSIGVLNAYCFVQNKLGDAEQVWRNQRFSGVASFAQMYARSSYVPDAIKEITKQYRPFKSSFYATLLNISNRTLNYHNLKDVEPELIWGYLQASVSLPLLSKVVEISGTKYCDGAIVDNIPVTPLVSKPLDYAIVVHFDKSNYVFENEHFDNKLIKLNFMDNKIIKDSLAFDKDSVAYMIEAGYEESISIFDMHFKKGIDDLEYIYSKAQYINALRGKQDFRLTGDIAMSNMNKVMKRIIRQKL
ncbi:MAG: patatin-like phospholipase family protein [Oscillospiraceae bacterium]|nr:patatin-like phospholipase family protein [Oscillospiraceae bacterium]